MFKCKVCGIKTDHKKGFVFRSVNTNCYCFLYFLTPFFCEINGERIEGEAGECIIHKKGATVIHGPLSEKESFINNWINFDCDDADITALNLPYDKVFHINEGDLFKSLLAQIMEEEAVKDEYSKQIISNLIFRLLVAFKRRTEAHESAEEKIYERFNDARIYIINHYSKPWTLKMMAERVGYSVSRFCALYKDFFGESPMNDLLKKRLKVSKHLLTIKAYKISDISLMCGFSSVHYFSKFFKQHTGKSPSEYA